VVKVGSTASLADDSTSVELEDHSVGFNSNRHWLVADCSQESIWVTRSNVSVSLDLETSELILAGTVPSSVWVSILSGEWVVMYIVES